MKRKIIVISTVGCILASFNLIGCAKNNNQMSKEATTTETVAAVQEKQEKPEEGIEKMYKGLIDKNLTFENIWDDYVSDTSKNIGILDKKAYVEYAKKSVLENDIVYKDIEVLSSEQIKENIFKVKSSLKCTAKGKDNFSELTDYVIQENNKFKYLVQGVMSVEKHADTTIENINYQNVSVINYVEGIGISIDIVNQSENGIALGWVNGSTVTLKTDKGKYSSTLNSIKIEKGQKQNIVVQFNNAEGTPQEIVINNINYLNNKGLPQNQDVRTNSIIIK